MALFLIIFMTISGRVSISFIGDVMWNDDGTCLVPDLVRRDLVSDTQPSEESKVIKKNEMQKKLQNMSLQ